MRIEYAADARALAAVEKRLNEPAANLLLAAHSHHLRHAANQTYNSKITFYHLTQNHHQWPKHCHQELAALARSATLLLIQPPAAAAATAALATTAAANTGTLAQPPASGPLVEAAAALDALLASVLPAMSVRAAMLVVSADAYETANTTFASAAAALGVAQYWGAPLVAHLPTSWELDAAESTSRISALSAKDAMLTATRLLKRRGARASTVAWPLPSRSMSVVKRALSSGEPGRGRAAKRAPHPSCTLVGAVGASSGQVDDDEHAACYIAAKGALAPTPSGRAVRNCRLPRRAPAQRSVVLRGMPWRWRRVATRLEAGDEVVVAFLGGSFSTNRSNGTWSSRAFRSLARRWPKANIKYHNGALGGVGSHFFSLCSTLRLPPRVDVIVLEHALNDAEFTQMTDGVSLREWVAHYEVYVRSLLRRHDRPALLWVHWDRIAWCPALSFMGERALKWGVPWLATPSSAADLVAAHYGMPSFSPRNSLFHADCSNADTRGVLCSRNARGHVESCNHLSQVGHDVVGDMVGHFLQSELEHSLRVTARSARVALSLPSPLISELSEFATPSMCARGQALQALMAGVNGSWRFAQRDPEQAPKTDDKPCLLSEAAPSSLFLNLTAAPSSCFYLGYLKSHKDSMGRLDIKCSGGCACDGKSVSGYHKKESSVMDVVRVPLLPGPNKPGACVVRLNHRKRRGSGAGKSSRFVVFALISGNELFRRKDLHTVAVGLSNARYS